ncbi:hypothetical protein FP2506_15579 [Fulvimarina pelagi HTCC2506]|uniref:Metallo-beta-lactamase domain-containing protein n=1 Tax=Fulvimarina pelagi HTCC2506 TaxID=314231 RepID=Q0G3G4_9HYPH|nr:MBL fold metallo-hydrolase [Fulvimarina pelagi]EAU41867.1 hypothetical protein FP2506_15579 [Fulvimarina pelagi HTCC2506]
MLDPSAIGDFEAASPNESGPGPGLTLFAMKAGRTGFANYAYIVADFSTGDAVVIDPGWEAEFLLSSLAAFRLRLAGICLTHGHRDHWMAAPAIARATGCPVHMSRLDADHFGFASNGLRPLEAPVALAFGSIGIEALETPGHTAGSISYRIGACLFSGDTLFSEGCGLSDPRNGGGDSGALFRSLDALRRTLPAECRIYPGHRYRQPIGRTFAALQRGNVYLKFRELEAFAGFCKRPARARQAPPAIGSVPDMTPELVTLHDPEKLCRKTEREIRHVSVEDGSTLRCAS